MTSTPRRSPSFVDGEGEAEGEAGPLLKPRDLRLPGRESASRRAPAPTRKGETMGGEDLVRLVDDILHDDESADEHGGNPRMPEIGRS